MPPEPQGELLPAIDIQDPAGTCQEHARPTSTLLDMIRQYQKPLSVPPPADVRQMDQLLDARPAVPVGMPVDKDLILPQRCVVPTIVIVCKTSICAARMVPGAPEQPSAINIAMTIYDTGLTTRLTLQVTRTPC
jgi:hypothetical protein